MFVWIYGTTSVLIISLIGLVIAFSSQSDHHFQNGSAYQNDREHHNESHHSHSDSVWYGLMALLGMMGFLLLERLIMILGDLAHQHMNESNEIQQCAPNSDLAIAPEMEKLNHHHNHEMNDVTKANMINGTKNGDVQVHDECHRSTITFPNPDGEGYMHLGAHHHHHHRTNKGPNAALMVLAGDLVHNLFDGLAIGVAFSGTGINGGLSTSLAILFHELPHELGDFAIIIRSGMSLKNAIFWNITASIICWFGMCIGILLGTINDAWLSALIAGTFLYIALVDMIPELDSCPQLPSKSRAIKLSVQLVGIAVGVGIMLVIALYEQPLRTLF
ncbi:hypothetical protein RDWZM_003433 [Blomia tropicalis]|uniref:Zinc transporter ZIP10 n=1 Tax=Blomia tropicalis TaxID=40697 RepID=A0A9Q0RQV3_BLOTA|nr:hypothetical protein RDWZM_003433 [Blomia tropicalis]